MMGEACGIATCGIRECLRAAEWQDFVFNVAAEQHQPIGNRLYVELSAGRQPESKLAAVRRTPAWVDVVDCGQHATRRVLCVRVSAVEACRSAAQ